MVIIILISVLKIILILITIIFLILRLTRTLIIDLVLKMLDNLELQTSLGINEHMVVDLMQFLDLDEDEPSDVGKSEAYHTKEKKFDLQCALAEQMSWLDGKHPPTAIVVFVLI